MKWYSSAAAMSPCSTVATGYSSSTGALRARPSKSEREKRSETTDMWPESVCKEVRGEQTDTEEKNRKERAKACVWVRMQLES